MDYFINSEIAEKYGVSSTTVIRWIENALVKKNSLLVDMRKNKPRILVGVHNEAEMRRLAEESVKYRNNSLSFKPEIDSQFYNIFNENEQISIINDLKNNQETKIKWTYKGEGADIWDLRYNSNVSPLKNSIYQMLEPSLKDLDKYLGDVKEVNIFDIGCGTGHPLLEPIKYFKKNYKVNYVALDISKDVLDIAKSNFKEWIPEFVFDTVELDFETMSMEQTIFEKWIKIKDSKNLIFCYGNTISNIDNRSQALKNIRSGMQKGDLFTFSFGLDTENNRAKLKYVQDPIVYKLQTQTLRMLGVDIESCEPEVFYDEVKRAKIKTLKLDKDYLIQFKQGATINLRKNDKIMIWKHNLLTMNKIVQEIEEIGFNLRIYKTDSDQSNALVVCEV